MCLKGGKKILSYNLIKETHLKVLSFKLVDYLEKWKFATKLFCQDFIPMWSLLNVLWKKTKYFRAVEQSMSL